MCAAPLPCIDSASTRPLNLRVVGRLPHDDARRVRLAVGGAGHEVLGRLVAEVREVEAAAPATARSRTSLRGPSRRRQRRQRHGRRHARDAFDLGLGARPAGAEAARRLGDGAAGGEQAASDTAATSDDSRASRDVSGMAFPLGTRATPYAGGAENQKAPAGSVRRAARARERGSIGAGRRRG